MFRIASALWALILAFLVAIQVDEYGELLIAGHKALAFVVLALLVYAVAVLIISIVDLADERIAEL